jgi:hypothetical protein
MTCARVALAFLYPFSWQGSFVPCLLHGLVWPRLRSSTLALPACSVACAGAVRWKLCCKVDILCCHCSWTTCLTAVAQHGTAYHAAPTLACCLAVCAQVVVPRLSTNGLRWQCSGDFVARQCLQYRGVLPVCADPSLGSPDGAILRAALQEVRMCQHIVDISS